MKKKHKQHHEEHIDETWLIPYADLLTLLLALFIILFAASQVDQKKYDQIMRGLSSAFNGGSSFFEISTTVPIENTDPNIDAKKHDAPSKEEQQKLEQLQKEKQDLEELKQKLDGYIQENGLTTQLETKLTNDMLMITIRDHALYASGSAIVKPEAKQLAVAISQMLTEYPNYALEVAGHTDNIPISNNEFETNWDLSSKRALNFMKILMQNSQIEQARFRSIGYGEFQPIETNATNEGRAKNRRVEVNIIRNIKQAEEKSVTP